MGWILPSGLQCRFYTGLLLCNFTYAVLSGFLCVKFHQWLWRSSPELDSGHSGSDFGYMLVLFGPFKPSSPLIAPPPWPLHLWLNRLSVLATPPSNNFVLSHHVFCRLGLTCRWQILPGIGFQIRFLGFGLCTSNFWDSVFGFWYSCSLGLKFLGLRPTSLVWLVWFALFGLALASLGLGFGWLRWFWLVQG